MTRCVSMNLSETAHGELEMMAKDAGVSITEVIRRAVGRMKFFADMTKKQSKLLLKDTDGSIQQIIPL